MHVAKYINVDSPFSLGNDLRAQTIELLKIVAELKDIADTISPRPEVLFKETF